jgi:AcrR family transcriptional regulator
VFYCTRANKNRAAGRRSQEEAERTRTRILDRAERLFARRGYRGVSLRELSRACGVQPFTIQHHFGSKPGLYQAVLSRWDEEILARVGAVLASEADLATTVEKVVEELFDFFLEKRGWVALSVRAALGEGLARGVSLKEQSWQRSLARGAELGATKYDLGLLLITVEASCTITSSDGSLQEAVRPRPHRSADSRAHEAASAVGDPALVESGATQLRSYDGCGVGPASVIGARSRWDRAGRARAWCSWRAGKQSSKSSRARSARAGARPSCCRATWPTRIRYRRPARARRRRGAASTCS